MKKIMSCILTFIILCWSLAGCNTTAETTVQSEVSQATILSDGQAADAVEPEEPDEEATVNESLYEEIDEEEAEKEVITIGTLSQLGSLESLVSKFNGVSDIYVAQIEVYDSLTTLNTKIISGDAPDVLFLTGIPYEQYIAKDIFIDISEVLDEADDYEPELRSITESQYNDCAAVVSYYFSCIAAPEYVLDGKESWTFDEFMEIASTTNAFEKYNKEECLMLYCMSNLGDYIDSENHTCSFESEQFYSALDFLNHFLEDDSQIVSDGKASDIDFTHDIVSVSDLNTRTYSEMFWGGSLVTVLGFPSNHGSEIKITPYLIFGIPYSANHIEGAMVFLEYSLSESYQSQVQTAFPVLHSVLSAKVSSTFSQDEEVAQEAINLANDLLNRTTAFTYVDSTVYGIVEEEVPAYFNGDKTAEEVAHLIQSRVQIYLDEQS